MAWHGMASATNCGSQSHTESIKQQLRGIPVGYEVREVEAFGDGHEAVPGGVEHGEDLPHEGGAPAPGPANLDPSWPLPAACRGRAGHARGPATAAAAA
jgi:hypothetical protein